MLLGDDAEKRWKNLRDRYTKERRKMRESHVSGASTSEVYFTNWSLFKYIDGFLGSVVLQADSTIGNDEPISQQIESAGINISDTTESFCEIDETSEMPESPCKKKQKTSKKSEDMLDVALKTFNETSKLLTETKEEDRIDFFCKSLNVRLRNLNKKDRHHVIKNIEFMMLEIEEKEEYLKE
ncbi:uncharacterized protein [Centruroides vittatus]|uniref:uncharacterized protein n=1 Tax=Centruroides vittatus TaxID=120091 RepID=UPI00350F459F